MNNAILLISCPDRKGITATVANFVYKYDGNILDAVQHIDEQSNTFFLRVEWALKDFKLRREQIKKTFAPLAVKYGMTWQLFFSDERVDLAVLVSQKTHCLYDLLLRQQAGQLPGRVRVIISNHLDAKSVARSFHIPFYYFSIQSGRKLEQEQKVLNVLKKFRVEGLVLARYGQILSEHFVARYPQRIINIHHSFLPAFVGAQPYAQAYRKGVKIIGATSHYVIPELDQGPIIEQDTVRISHRDSLKDLVRKGEDLEKMVLSRAVRWHMERKILVYNHKTVVFD